MKPDVVQFGQAMPEKETREAQIRAGSCDLFLVCGSSLVVYPAAEMPLIAKNAGARLVIINLVETPHDDYADVVINEKIGDVLPRIVERAKAINPS
jgi:NAD-dependent deacetylase